MRSMRVPRKSDRMTLYFSRVTSLMHIGSSPEGMGSSGLDMDIISDRSERQAIPCIPLEATNKLVVSDAKSN